MKTHRTDRESVVIDKKTFDSMVRDLGRLLEDLEKIDEKRHLAKVDKRLRDVKEGRIKLLGKKDFHSFLKRRS
ncbi:MAG TPA: hypothetical protein VJH90_01135 [archaeon]|nr:hypothetical protein [archaeon]